MLKQDEIEFFWAASGSGMRGKNMLATPLLDACVSCYRYNIRPVVGRQ